LPGAGKLPVLHPPHSPILPSLTHQFPSPQLEAVVVETQSRRWPNGNGKVINKMLDPQPP
jgi:hypothetical protein